MDKYETHRKTKLLSNYEETYQALAEKEFVIPKGIQIKREPNQEFPSDMEQKICNGIFALKRPVMATSSKMAKDFEKFDVWQGEYLPTGESYDATMEAIRILNKITELRKELGIKDGAELPTPKSPLQQRNDKLSAAEEKSEKLSGVEALLNSYLEKEGEQK